MKATYLIALFSFAVLFVANSYVCDDAVISLRSIHNFANGYGLTFNPGERVQVFTGPLFTLCIAFLYLLLRILVSWNDVTLLYVTTLTVSFFVSFAAVILLVTRERDRISLLVVTGLLFSSQAFMLNCSSGLETPMTLLLTALFFARYLSSTEGQELRDLTILLMVASLCVTNRLDTLLLFSPATLHILLKGWGRHKFKVLPSVLLAFIPLCGWLLFSLVYYGFLFPNSYYAKLGLNVSLDLRHLVGWRYLVSTIQQDPLTFTVIVFGVFLSFMERRFFFAMLGAIIYLFYVYDIGGDFIGYRFFAAPFLIALLVVQTSIKKLSRRWAVILTGCLIPSLIVYNSMVPFSPFRAQIDESPNFDVRAYFGSSNILRVIKAGVFPSGPFHAVMSLKECDAMRSKSHEVFVGSGGLFTLCRGPLSHSIDPLSITDPLIARLPTPEQKEPYIPGHIVKPVPRGYVKSLRHSKNEITDKALRPYYQELRTIISGDLFSVDRLKAIISMNFGSKKRYAQPYLVIKNPVP